MIWLAAKSMSLTRRRAERLVLSGRGDVAIKCEVTQEIGDLFFAHLLRVTFIVEEDEPANPIDVGLFGANAVAFDAQVPADAVEEFGWRVTGRGRRIFRDAKVIIRLGNDGKGDRGRLPPVVSSLFSIKAAHWRDGIRGTELGARGKERTARGVALCA